MASQSLPSVRWIEKGKIPSKDGKLMEPLLSDLSAGKQNSRKYTPKLTKRIRHCHSAPELDESSPNINLNENAIKPNKNYDAKFTILVASVVFFIYLGVGMACFYAMEQDLQGERTNSLIDALYFSIVTMTTVGYGDLVPNGVPAKLFTCAFVFVGFGLVGLLLGSAADFLVERQEIMLVKALSGNNRDSDYTDFSGSNQIRRVQLKVAISGLIVLVLFGTGLLVMIEVEGMSFVEAFYCVCVTVTTLGYGDVTFQTTGGRAFAVIWILISTINVAQFFLYIAELYTEGRRQSLVQWVLTRKTTSSDLEAADMDNNGVVSASEFVVYKLKEMGKIEEQDVVEILKEFDSLDVDNSGTLSPYDLKLAQTVEA